MDGDAGNDILKGGDGRDSLEGGNGADILYGQDGNDRLDGGDGNDIMYGGRGNDIFVFDSRDDRDTIRGFVAGGTDDRLDISDAGFDFRNLDDVRARATDVGSNVVIALGTGDQVTLVGVQEADLTAADFIF